MMCNVPVAEVINGEGVLPEPVQEALGQLGCTAGGTAGAVGAGPSASRTTYERVGVVGNRWTALHRVRDDDERIFD